MIIFAVHPARFGVSVLPTPLPPKKTVDGNNILENLDRSEILLHFSKEASVDGKFRWEREFYDFTTLYGDAVDYENDFTLVTLTKPPPS